MAAAVATVASMEEKEAAEEMRKEDDEEGRKWSKAESTRMEAVEAFFLVATMLAGASRMGRELEAAATMMEEQERERVGSAEATKTEWTDPRETSEKEINGKN